MADAENMLQRINSFANRVSITEEHNQASAVDGVVVAEIARVAESHAGGEGLAETETEAGFGREVMLDRSVVEEIRVRHSGVDEERFTHRLGDLDAVAKDFLLDVGIEFEIAVADFLSFEVANLVGE